MCTVSVYDKRIGCGAAAAAANASAREGNAQACPTFLRRETQNRFSRAPVDTRKKIE